MNESETALDALWTEPSSGSTAAFLVIVLFVAAWFVAARWKLGFENGEEKTALRFSMLRVGVSIAIWMFATATIAQSGWLAHQGPPPALPVFFVLVFGASAVLSLSSLGSRVSMELPLRWLIGLHVFRLPLELVLLQWTKQGVVPTQMTFEGHNFDVLTGVLALLLWGYSFWRQPPRWSVVAFNAIGSFLLLVVIVIVILSSPLAIKAYPGRPILLALHAPFVWIGSVCVAAAFAGHWMLWRRILRNTNSRFLTGHKQSDG